MTKTLTEKGGKEMAISQHLNSYFGPFDVSIATIKKCHPIVLVGSKGSVEFDAFDSTAHSNNGTLQKFE